MLYDRFFCFQLVTSVANEVAKQSPIGKLGTFLMSLHAYL